MKHFSFNQSFIKSILVVVLTVCSLQMWGEDVTFSDQGYTNTESVTSYEGSTFTVAFSNAKYYTNGSAIRAYSGSTITVTPKSGKLTAFTIAFGSSDGSNTITANVGTYSAGSWSGEEDEVILTIGGSSGNRRIAGFSGVTAGSSSCSVDPTVGNIMNAVSSITSSGATFSTSAGVSAGTDCSLSEVGFVYNTTGTPTITDTKATITSYTSGALNKSITGLTANTTYYVRAYAKNEHGTAYSDEKSFSTPALAGVAYELVTSNSDLEDGAEIVILDVDGGTALSTTQNSNNRSSTSSGFTLSGTTATVTGDNIEVLTLTESSSDWELVTHDSKYLYTVSGNNYLRTQTTNTDAGVWTITINSTTHVATIYCSNTTRYLKKNGSSALYSAYASGQKDVQIYKKASGPIKVTSSFTKFTYVLGSGPSASQTFKVQGTDLAGNLTITAPTNYQISQNGSSWSNSITLNKDGDDDVAETTLYIRLNADLAKGEYDGDITFSDGTNDKTVAIEGSVTITCSTPSISFTEATVNKYRGDADFKIDPNVSGNTLGATISWASDKESCATVGSDGTVHILKATGAGAYVRITATLNAKETAVACQNEVSAYYDIYIKNKVTWLVNNVTYSAGGPTTEVTEGAKITTAPSDPDGSTMCGGKTFVGWTTSEVAVEQATAPSPLYSSTTVKNINIENNITFYAVFAETDGSGDEVFKKGTSAELAEDQTVIIVNAASNKALSSTATANQTLTATLVTIASDKITNPTSDLKWTVKEASGDFRFMQGSNYLWAGYDEKYTLNATDDYDDTWSVSTSGDHYTVNSTYYSGYKLEYYSTNDEFTIYNGSGDKYAMDFYFPYTSYTAYSTTCGPNIKAGTVEYLTSYKDQTVLSDSIVVRGSSLTADGTLTPSITGTDAGLFSCTLASNAISAAGAIESKFVIRYTPTAFGDAQHTATLTFSDGTTTSDPITLNGRSLPEEFAIVAYDGAQYYVLDGSMGSTSNTVKALPVTISGGYVDLCPTQAVYSLTERTTPDQYVHLIGSTNRRLYGEGSGTGLSTKSLTSTSGTGWLLATSNFNTYHITNADAPHRCIIYNDANDVFGHYKTSNYGATHFHGDIQLLPITAKCTCLPAPISSVVARATIATITWDAVAGAASYVVTCDGGNAPVYDGCKATITGLSNNSDYTFTVKAVAVSGTDCSLLYHGDFRTTDCNDVPYNIQITPGVKSVTVKWKMDYSSSATIRIYTDAECNTQHGSDHTGLTSPAMIEGLNENTTYYMKIWAGGTCVSDVKEFLTNSTSVEIVEWFTDSIRIMLDADDHASVLIEDKQEKASGGSSKVADKLFFAKYFEGEGSMKLISIYNGTDEDVDLSTYIINVRNNGSSDEAYALSPVGSIAKGQEIIFFSRPLSTEPVYTCSGDFLDSVAELKKPTDNPRWIECASGKLIDKVFNFNGNDALQLKNGSNVIDCFGAIGALPSTKNCRNEQSWKATIKNMDYGKSVSDFPGISPSDLSDYGIDITNPTITAFTARVILFRDSSVVNGDNAVANNTSTFSTFASEWNGRYICNSGTSGRGTCISFEDLGIFDYNKYYAQYDSLTTVEEIGGKRNEDGTYTIPIDSLDTLACTMMRIKVYEGGVEKASREYKIPIMVEGNKTTKDTIFINDNPNQLRTYNTCKECDVLILKGATLTKASHLELKDQDTINNLTIYPGGKFIVPEGDNYKYAVNSIHFRVQGEETPIVKLKGKVTTHDGQITVSRRITNDRYYFFSLPYDCDVSDIRWSNGEVPTRGADYEIIEYDAATRAVQGSAKGAPGHWKPAGSTLHAGVGYCVAVSSAYIKELMFPMSIGGTDEDLTNKEDTKTTNKVTLERHTGSSSINNHNWNLIAHPYVSPFDAYEDGKITAGWLNCVSPETETEDAVWEYVDETHVYLTMPSFGASKTTYTQTVSSSITTLNPFLAVFVQAVSAGDLTFDKNHRQLNAAPARHLAAKAENEDESIFVGVTLSGNGQSDQTNVRIRPDFTDEYQLGYDLQKFTTFYTSRPQIYMKPADLQLAFQAVNDDKAKNTWMPMGVYCYEPGTFTFALSEDYPIDEVEAVYLYDKTTGTTTNLLYDTYTITTSKQLYSNTRFALNVIVNRRAPQITTDINAAGAPENMVRKILINGHVFIQRGETIYDVTGKQVENR